MSTESAAHKGCFFMDIRRCYDLFQTDRRVSGCSEATLRFYEYVIGKLISCVFRSKVTTHFGLKLPLNSEQSYHLFRFESYHF